MIIQRNNRGQYTITLPKPLVEGMRWDKGQRLEFQILSKGEIVLRER
jgi:bifunctional DNA-binding transcriptional regulator/antitoxin component of YhaV-PrlF toxin-antitoxin module